MCPSLKQNESHLVFLSFSFMARPFISPQGSLFSYLPHFNDARRQASIYHITFNIEAMRLVSAVMAALLISAMLVTRIEAAETAAQIRERLQIPSDAKWVRKSILYTLLKF